MIVFHNLLVINGNVYICNNFLKYELATVLLDAAVVPMFCWLLSQGSMGLHVYILLN